MIKINTLLNNTGLDYTQFSMKCELDFKFFCENVLGDFPLYLNTHGGIHNFQMEWFYTIHNNKRVIIQAPAGFSKTTIVGIAYPIWLAFTRPNKQILITSKTMPQSTRILGLIRQAIEENELLSKLKPENYSESWTKQELKTISKCRIYCRPYSVNIKGERVDYMLLDELASYEDPNIFFDYLIPRLNPEGTLAGITTPESPTDLINLIKLKCPNYIFKTYKAIENGQSIWPERFPLELLEQRKKELGEEFFEKNYMCNPKAESENAIFSKKAIFNSFDMERDFSTEIEGKAFIGCDFAISSGPTADFDAYVVIDKTDNFLIIKWIETNKGVLIPVKTKRIEELNQIYKPVRTIVDKSNLGVGVIEDLRTKALFIKEQGFHPQERRELLNTLRNAIDSGKLIIPRNSQNLNHIKLIDELIVQLMGFKEVESKVTKVKHYVSTTVHDDIVMALAMAVKEAMSQKSTRIYVASGT